jgi:hypothetical protein
MELFSLIGALTALAIVAARYGVDSREPSSKGWLGRPRRF